MIIGNDRAWEMITLHKLTSMAKYSSWPGGKYANSILVRLRKKEDLFVPGGA